ncbi:MAG: HAD family hydrolase [Candidatus Omnitrophota bacterium]
MPKYKLLIFDFDGTLVDTAPDIALYANAVLAEHGFHARSLPEVKKAVGRGVHELLRELAPAFGEDPPKLDEAVISFKKRYWEKPVVHTRPFRGVVETLSGPLRPFKKAIVTNKPHGLTQKILDELSLGSFFDGVIGLDMEFPAKPDPASVRRVMESQNALPAETLFLGDSYVDAKTCRNAGVDFAWVDWGYDRANGFKPAFTFSSPLDWATLAV